MVISYNLIIINDIIFEGGRMRNHLLRLRMSGVMPPLAICLQGVHRGNSLVFAETRNGNDKRGFR